MNKIKLDEYDKKLIKRICNEININNQAEWIEDKSDLINIIEEVYGYYEAIRDEYNSYKQQVEDNYVVRSDITEIQ